MADRGILTVVLACAEPGKPTLSDSVAAVQRELAEVGGELLLVASPASLASVEGFATHVGARCIASKGHLVPELWGDGWRASSGDAVAFLIPECQVRPGWARTLLAELDRGAGGAGGYFALHPAADATDAAVYFLRYAAFSDAAHPTRDVEDIAGDNAVYSRTVLARHAASFANGFWEVDLHRKLRAERVRLVMAGGAVAEFSGAPRLAAMARQRLTHGRHFGAWRAAQGGRSPLVALLLAPAVPVVLMARIIRRVWARASERGRLIAALPALVVLSCAWALGEALGALGGPTQLHEATE